MGKNVGCVTRNSVSIVRKDVRILLHSVGCFSGTREQHASKRNYLVQSVTSLVSRFCDSLTKARLIFLPFSVHVKILQPLPPEEEKKTEHRRNWKQHDIQYSLSPKIIFLLGINTVLIKVISKTDVLGKFPFIKTAFLTALFHGSILSWLPVLNFSFSTMKTTMETHVFW